MSAFITLDQLRAALRLCGVEAPISNLDESANPFPSLVGNASGNLLMCINGADPSNTASANTAAIQAALNAGGRIFNTKPGTYFLSSTLTIPDNTELVSGPGVEYKASGVIGNLLQSSAYSAAATPVTVTWSSGLTASVQWNGHPFSASDACWLYGATNDSAFTGVFTLASITDVNNFVVRLRRVPSGAPVGTTYAKKANKNIAVRGGKWNYNASGGNGGTPGPALHAMILGGIHNVTAENLEFADTSKFGLCVGAVANPNLRNIRGYQLNSDLVKVYGPAFNVVATDIYGDCGDDIMSTQNQEGVSFSAYDWTHGDVLGVTINGISGYTVSAGFTMYLAPFGITEGVTVNGFNALAQSGAPGGNIVLDNSYATGGVARSIVINAPFFVSPYNGIWISRNTNPISEASVTVIEPTYLSTNYDTGALFNVNNSGTKATVRGIGGYVDKVYSLLTTAAGTTVHAKFDSIRTNNIKDPFKIAGDAVVEWDNITCDAALRGTFLNIDGTASPTVTVRPGKVNGVTPTMTKSGTPTLYVDGRGMAFDGSAITISAAAKGYMFYNSNGAFGTGAGLYAVSDAGAAVKVA